jgi:hypothetical protein
MRDIDVFINGRSVEPKAHLFMKKGRYPVMVRAAISTVQRHEKLGWHIRFLTVDADVAEDWDKPAEAEPLQVLPADLKAPVLPLAFNTMPARMVGAWPLKSEVGSNPYVLMKGTRGTLIEEGTSMVLNGKEHTFRALEPGVISIVNQRGVRDDQQFNVVVGRFRQWGPVEHLGLHEKDMFGDATDAKGLFSAVLWTRREVSVQAQCRSTVRCWLGGKRCGADKTINLKPGFYPFLVEIAGMGSSKPNWPMKFVEVASPELELERWKTRIERNRDFLERIALSAPESPAGQAAKDMLAQLGPKKK